MSNKLIEEGQIIELMQDEEVLQLMIRAINEKDDEVILVPLEAKRSYERIRYPLNELKGKLESKEAQYISSHKRHNEACFEVLSEDEQQKALKKHKYITNILEAGITKFTEKKIKGNIAKTAEDYKEKPPSWFTVRRWYDQFKEADFMLAGLFPRERFRGKSRRQIDERAEEIISKHAKLYFSKQQVSIQSVYDDVEGEIEKFNKSHLDNPIKLPDYSAIRDRLQNNSYRKKIEKRKGKRALNADLAAKKSDIQTSKVLQRVEMDHTQLDIFLLDDETHTLIGRPYLTILIDHYSHMVLGFQLSFENPSSASASWACINAFLPKTLHRDIGVDYDWPAHGVPMVIVVDNGKEFWGKNFQTSASELGIIIQYCPIRKAWYKSCVERFYGIVRTRVTDKLPGAVKKPGQCAEDYDAKSEAKMTFSQFRKYFMNWLLGEYHNSLDNKHNKTPNQLWRISEDYLSVPVQNRKKILPKLMATGSRKNDSGSVVFENIDYSSHFLTDIYLRDGREDVVFKYNPFDLGSILVWDKVNRVYILVDADDYSYAKNLSLHEHKNLKKKMREEGKKALNTSELKATKIELFEMREEARNKNIKKEKQVSTAKIERAKQTGIEKIELSQIVSNPERVSPIDYADIEDDDLDELEVEVINE